MVIFSNGFFAEWMFSGGGELFCGDLFSRKR